MATTKRSTGTAGKPAARKRAGARAAKTASRTTRAAKPAAAAAPAPTPGTDRKPKGDGKARSKPVRDSFTMPPADFGLIAALKERAIGFRRPAKKSELLRAGLHALAVLDDAALRQALDALAPIKSGRPKKS